MRPHGRAGQSLAGRRLGTRAGRPSHGRSDPGCLDAVRRRDPVSRRPPARRRGATSPLGRRALRVGRHRGMVLVLVVTSSRPAASRRPRRRTTPGAPRRPGRSRATAWSSTWPCRPRRSTCSTDLAQAFNRLDEAAGRRPLRVRPTRSSRRPARPPTAAGRRLERPTATDPAPVIWSPARRAPGAPSSTSAWPTRARPPMADRGTPFMLTPLVIAMPQPMAEALGWPDKPHGLRRHPAPGQRPGGLGARTAIPSGARSGSARPTRTSRPAGCRALDRPGLRGHRQDAGPHAGGPRPSPRSTPSTRGVESAVVHYGDTTLTFLNNWYRGRPARAPRCSYASAVAVEEKSVIDYNTGNPDGDARPGRGAPPAPRSRSWRSTRRRARSSPTTRSIVLDAAVGRPTTSGRARQRSRTSSSSPTTRSKVLQYGFRPGNPTVAIGDARSSPTTASIPNQPQTLLAGARSPTCSSTLLDRWAQQRKSARVLLVHRRVRVDGATAPIRTTARQTKLDLAKQAAIDSLDQFKRRRRGRPARLHHRPRARRATGSTSTSCRSARSSANVQRAAPTRSTAWSRLERHAALRRSTEPAYDQHGRRATTRPASTPSCCSPTARNDDGEPDDDDQQLQDLLDRPAAESQGENGQPVRVFTDRLRRRRRPRHAPAASPRPPTAPVYDASDPRASTRSSPPWSATSESDCPSGAAAAGIAASATASSPRRWPAPSPRRAASCWPAWALRSGHGLARRPDRRAAGRRWSAWAAPGGAGHPPRTARRRTIDPFRLREPWRSFVQRGRSQAQHPFAGALRTVPRGPAARPARPRSTSGIATGVRGVLAGRPARASSCPSPASADRRPASTRRERASVEPARGPPPAGTDPGRARSTRSTRSSPTGQRMDRRASSDTPTGCGCSTPDSTRR